ncbi:PEP-CTERM sorting domain-containing protein [Skermanella sp. TT6]|uniref:PEP-CTERM sorting domain-containing protein n=1 Tax=Skermanella cutis TaxID=2775420 RepID=A0ABX7BAL4_9PROT|nr:PEP-CTERM sorting domain-containing protein [Skermanella sp. TT6]
MVAEVPEPVTLALIAAGGVGLSLVRHRRRQKV